MNVAGERITSLHITLVLSGATLKRVLHLRVYCFRRGPNTNKRDYWLWPAKVATDMNEEPGIEAKWLNFHLLKARRWDILHRAFDVKFGICPIQ